LEMHQGHDLHQVAHVQRIGGGIEADVTAGRPFSQMLLHAGRAVLQHAAPAQLLNEILHGHDVECWGKEREWTGMPRVRGAGTAPNVRSACLENSILVNAGIPCSPIWSAWTL